MPRKSKSKVQESVSTVYGTWQGLKGVARSLDLSFTEDHEIVLATLVFGPGEKGSLVFSNASFRVRKLSDKAKSFSARYQECKSFWTVGSTLDEVLDFIVKMRCHGKIVVKYSGGIYEPKN